MAARGGPSRKMKDVRARADGSFINKTGMAQRRAKKGVDERQVYIN